jgi:hypothetical protein
MRDSYRWLATFLARRFRPGRQAGNFEGTVLYNFLSHEYMREMVD